MSAETLSAPMAAVAQLVGECRLGILSARSFSGWDMIAAVSGLQDPKELGDSRELHELLDMMRKGEIRRDDRWILGPDPELVRLADVAQGGEGVAP